MRCTTGRPAPPGRSGSVPPSPASCLTTRGKELPGGYRPCDASGRPQAGEHCGQGPWNRSPVHRRAAPGTSPERPDDLGQAGRATTWGSRASAPWNRSIRTPPGQRQRTRSRPRTSCLREHRRQAAPPPAAWQTARGARAAGDPSTSLPSTRGSSGSRAKTAAQRPASIAASAEPLPDRQEEPARQREQRRSGHRRGGRDDAPQSRGATSCRFGGLQSERILAVVHPGERAVAWWK